MLKKLIKRAKLQTTNWRRDWLRQSHVLNYLFWECTLNCNFFCQHCGSSAGKKVYTDELTTAEIKKVFSDIAVKMNAKKIMIAITGGEPLLRPDLFEVMSYAHHELGFNWGMVTNGFLVNEDNIEKMKESGMSSVSVSIDGIGRTHDDLRGVAGAYDRAINAIRLLQKIKTIKILQITTTANRRNFPEIEKLYDIFLPLGINSWRVMNVDPIGRAELNKELMLTPEELRWLLNFVYLLRKTSPIDVTYGCEGFLGLEYEGEVRDWNFYCGTGINVGSILHNGDIFVCPNVPRRPELIQGNVRNDNFVDVWNNKFQMLRDKNRTACADCQNCEWWEECLGGSFHLWDFANKKPKICHIKMIEK